MHTIYCIRNSPHEYKDITFSHERNADEHFLRFLLLLFTSSIVWFSVALNNIFCVMCFHWFYRALYSIQFNSVSESNQQLEPSLSDHQIRISHARSATKHCRHQCIIMLRNVSLNGFVTWTKSRPSWIQHLTFFECNNTHSMVN